MFDLPAASGHADPERYGTWGIPSDVIGVPCLRIGRHMEIHSKSQDRLEIRHRPVFWAVIFGCMLFVLAGWGLAGLIEGEWIGALVAVGIGVVMGWLVFRQFLLSFSLTLDRGTDRISYLDSKGGTVDTPLGRLTSVACDAQLNTDNGEAEKSLLLKLDQAGDPPQIRLASFKLRTEDVLDSEHAITQWWGQDAGGAADRQGLDITVPVLPIAWLALAVCALLVLNGLAAIFMGDVVRAALLVAIGGGAGYAWLEKVLVRLDLRFDPSSGVIELKRSNLLGTTTWLLPLRHFDGAERIERALPIAQVKKFRKGSANVDLLFRNTRPNMTISLSPLGMPEADAKRITSQINTWMKDQDEARA
jgi:hypothetical protein